MLIDNRSRHFEEIALGAALALIPKEGEQFNAGADEWAMYVLRKQMDEQEQRDRAARDETYFYRLDVCTEALGEQRYYISKYTSFKTEYGRIVDWRAPIAALYYNGTRGPGSYPAPKGQIASEVRLRRKLSVHEGRLYEMLDEYDALDSSIIVSGQEGLQERLKRSSGGQMQEIVETIQRDQYQVIRYPLVPGVIIEGPAGSGKTAIALHRVAYLLHPDNTTAGVVDARSTLILGPNKLFLAFVQNVLPSLIINGIIQTTFERYWWSIALEPVKPKKDEAVDSLEQRKRERSAFVIKATQFHEWCERWVEEKVDANMNQRTILGLRAKQSVRMAKVIEAYRDIVRNGFIFDLPMLINVGIHKISIPVEKLHEVAQAIINGKDLTLNNARETIVVELTEWVRTAIIGKRLISHEARSELSVELKRQVEAHLVKNCHWPAYQSCLQEYKEWEKTIKNCSEKKSNGASVVGLLQKLLTDYELLSKCAYTHLTEFEIDAIIEIGTMNTIIAREDLPLLMLLEHLFIKPITPIWQHIVIDEAQDMSPMQYLILSLLSTNQAFTILGDLHQRVFPDRGIHTWDELEEAKAYAQKFTKQHTGHIQHYAFNISYRSTMEIMDFANSLNRDFGGTKQGFVTTKRSGPAPHIQGFETTKDLYSAIISVWLPHFLAGNALTIAILTKSSESAHYLAEQLRQVANVRSSAMVKHISEIKDLIHQSESSHLKSLPPGLLCGAVWQAKGLEFDVVIIPNANQANYKDNDNDRALLYVAATRAMHELYVFWRGPKSLLLEPYLSKHQLHEHLVV